MRARKLAQHADRNSGESVAREADVSGDDQPPAAGSLEQAREQVFVSGRERMANCFRV
jgi:hypothetical protein